MNWLREKLSGFKTYIFCAITILTAIGAFAAGEASFGQAITAIWAAITAMFLRAGIAKN